eukprot:TRINITY_DN13942_c0_g1_i3.p1 TRINITY_DN13942_c0_g1~~TRINITY_DN13942_c0_g1_i3.p1  ORF type:complete len:230 (-),score=90.03 TRINITY_DN13942_c0_g1_i3:361-1050(-)
MVITVKKRSDKVAKRVVGQALAFNRVAERVAVWGQLKSQAKEEGWSDAEAQRRFRVWKAEQAKAKDGKAASGAPVKRVESNRVAEDRKRFQSQLSALPPRHLRELTPPRCNAKDLAARVRMLDSSNSSSEGSAGGASSSSSSSERAKAKKKKKKPSSAKDVVKQYNQNLRAELEARRNKEAMKAKRKEDKKAKKKQKKDAKEEKKRAKKDAKKKKKEQKKLKKKLKSVM